MKASRRQVYPGVLGASRRIRERIHQSLPSPLTTDRDGGGAEVSGRIADGGSEKGAPTERTDTASRREQERERAGPWASWKLLFGAFS
jgi:hypothetical protein